MLQNLHIEQGLKYHCEYRWTTWRHPSGPTRVLYSRSSRTGRSCWLRSQSLSIQRFHSSRRARRLPGSGRTNRSSQWSTSCVASTTSRAFTTATCTSSRGLGIAWVGCFSPRNWSVPSWRTYIHKFATTATIVRSEGLSTLRWNTSTWLDMMRLLSASSQTILNSSAERLMCGNSVKDQIS